MTGAASRPIYTVIADDLMRLIVEGGVSVGERLPSEAELCRTYGVSRMTVRQAVTALVDGGYVERRRGSGTFVQSTKLERSASRMLGFEEDMLLRGLTPTTVVLRSGWTTAGPEEREFLRLDGGARVLSVERLRSVNGEPIGTNQITLPQKWGELLEGQDFSRSLYALLREVLDDEVKEAEQRIEATPADHAQATLLRVARGAPLLRIVRTTFLRRHGLIGLTRTYYRGDRYYLSLKVSREALEQGGPA